MTVKRLKYCAGGEWKDSKTGIFMPVTDSNTGKVIAETPCCTREEVDEAVAAAKAAYPAWASTPVSERAQLMFRFKTILEENIEELTMVVCTELGKNVNEARGDIIKAIEVVELACAAPVLMQGDSIMNVSSGHDTVMYREPLGVFAGIVPYNFPGMIPFGWMLPLCITTGNTFVLKAASQVPQTAMRMLELLIEAGLPAGVVNLVTCSRKEAELLLSHPDVKGISYVGSTKVGRHIYATAAASGKRVQALCEAKNHALVLKDAILDITARRIINSSFGCAGQRCMALPVVCVVESVANELVFYIEKFARELIVGPGYDPKTDLGPVVSAEHKNSICSWIEKGLAEGASLVLDGRNIEILGYENGYYLGPTIIDHVTRDMEVGKQEIFGPVVCIKRVKNFEEGIYLMNECEFANGSCIFTQSGYFAREFASRTAAGMVGINVGIPVPMAVFPFSGHKNSFFGDLHVMGKDGVAFYTETKSVTSKWFTGTDSKDKTSTWEGTISRA